MLIEIETVTIQSSVMITYKYCAFNDSALFLLLVSKKTSCLGRFCKIGILNAFIQMLLCSDNFEGHHNGDEINICVEYIAFSMCVSYYLELARRGLQ